MSSLAPTLVFSNAGILRVEPPARSELLQGTNRIFFVNVLGFDISDESSGYISQQIANPQTLSTVLSYLKDNGFKVRMDKESKSLVTQLHSDSNLIRDARAAGERLKRHPP